MTEGNPIPSHDAAAESEHLLGLYKMSATAGAGTAEYVAVNVTAVIAVLCGVASILAFLGDILMVVPVAGITLGFVALRQISRSNGTQTGKRLAWLGVVLSVLIGGGLLGFRGIDAMHRRGDEQQISDLCQRLGDLISQNKLDDAYELFDSNFHDRTNLATFKADIAARQHNSVTPPIDGIEWNGVSPVFQTDSNGDANVDMEIKAHLLNRPDESSLRWSARLRQSGTLWRFDSIPDLFPAPKTANAAPPGQ